MTSGERNSRARVLAVLLVAMSASATAGPVARAADAGVPARAVSPPVAPVAPGAPVAPAGPKLGRLEQESVDDALVDLGIQIDPHPDGKIIRAVHVVNQEVFSKRDWWFRWFNIFHRTTRGPIIERELLVRAGQAYDAALVEESLRNLQASSTITVGGKAFPAPDLSSVIVIVPVVAPAQPPGTVDLLV